MKIRRKNVCDILVIIQRQWDENEWKYLLWCEWRKKTTNFRRHCYCFCCKNFQTMKKFFTQLTWLLILFFICLCVCVLIIVWKVNWPLFRVCVFYVISDYLGSKNIDFFFFESQLKYFSDTQSIQRVQTVKRNIENAFMS